MYYIFVSAYFLEIFLQNLIMNYFKYKINYLKQTVKCL